MRPHLPHADIGLVTLAATLTLTRLDITSGVRGVQSVQIPRPLISAHWSLRITLPGHMSPSSDVTPRCPRVSVRAGVPSASYLQTVPSLPASHPVVTCWAPVITLHAPLLDSACLTRGQGRLSPDIRTAATLGMQARALTTVMMSWTFRWMEFSEICQ